MNEHILLIEDEPGLVLTVTDRLRGEHYRVTSVADGREGLNQALSGRFSLILLDLMLPGLNGLDICRQLRQERITTPILMLTARRDVTDKVVGLKLGADDYLTKPFAMAELLARIEALLRRTVTPDGIGDEELVEFAFADVRIDFRRAMVFCGSEPVELSAREFELLRYFVLHRGEALSRQRLLTEVWGYDETPCTRTVDVHVAGLRAKLGCRRPDRQFLITVHGIGYKFVQDVVNPPQNR